jgi:hypothetical protein
MFIKREINELKWDYNGRERDYIYFFFLRNISLLTFEELRLDIENMP